MPLQYQIDSLEGVDESVKSLYAEKDGKFILSVDGLPEQEDVSGLKAKVDELLFEKKAVSQKANDAEDAAAKAAEEAARKSGDTEALEKSWQDKYGKREAELQAELDSLSHVITGLTSGQTATKMAADIAVQGSSDVLLPHIERRLKTEYKDGQAKTVVLDKDGRPSAMTINELKQEFQDNPAFAPLIVGSKASGGGANGGGGRAVTKKFNEMNGAELKALREKRPEEYDRLKSEHYG